MHTMIVVLALASLPEPAAALARAQDAGAAQRTDLIRSRSDDDRSKELNRILHLAGGGSIRAKSRWSGDHWEYRTANQWSALPGPAVERVALEREVVARSKELARAADKADPGARVRLADWMLREGLLDEGVAELERVLEVDADQKDALALLRQPPVPILVPGANEEELSEAIRIAATCPRSLQECAAAALAQRPEPNAVMEALDQALASHSARIRTFAALAIRRLDPNARVRSLLTRSVLDGSESVRLEASRALRDTGQEAVAIPVIRALGSPSPAVRENAIEALGNMGFPAAVEPLVSRLAAISSSAAAGGGWTPPASNIFVGRQVAYVQDFDVEVAQFASVADPQINTLIEGSVLDVRVIGVWETSYPIESRRIRSSLAKLTGADPGSTNKSWIDWWEANKNRFGIKSPPKPTTPSSD